MMKLMGLLALLVVFSLPTLAQDTPVAQFGGGYTYRSFEAPFSPRLNMNGWNATVEYNFKPWLALAGDFDGTYNSQPDPVVTGNDKTAIYSYLFGPRIYPMGHRKITPFVHALFGIGYTSVTFPNGDGTFTSTTDNAFTWDIGGGIDVTVSKHIGVRIAKFDYERMGLFGAGNQGNPYQNNFKYSAALLIRFGQK